MVAALASQRSITVASAEIPERRRPADTPWRSVRATILFLAAIVAVGCASADWVMVRSVPNNPLSHRLRLISRYGPKPTERTEQLLRKYDLDNYLQNGEQSLLATLQQSLIHGPDAEKMYSVAELAYLEARQQDLAGTPTAADLYLASAAHAYLYLFDERFTPQLNPYDPQFRGACEIYNTALEGAMRLLQRRGPLRPGNVYAVRSSGQVLQVAVVSRSRRWRDEDFDRIGFVSDYEVRGLKNLYRTYGLGVPLIVGRNEHPTDDPAAPYYPPDFSFPVTAFLRLLPQDPTPSGDGSTVFHAVLEYYDPLEIAETSVADRRVPLETDISTPLAYYLDNPELRRLDVSTIGLLDPKAEIFETRQGLYMLEPFEPGKIPVLMVHGLWSSPITWMEMFNDLRGSPAIRDRYQFWFYLYPTGQPYLRSAAQLREELASLRDAVDPFRRDIALDQMVLIGHSMGGLVSRLQTVSSDNNFWRIISETPLESLPLKDGAREALSTSFFFAPNPSVRRVITVATPFHGSTASNSLTRWLARKFISLPDVLINTHAQLLSRSRAETVDPELANVPTSVDSLAPNSPVLAALRNSPRSAHVVYHNVVARTPQNEWLARFSPDSDGVVSVASATTADAASQIVVEADHSSVHRHPLTVLEVHRILLEHLVESDVVTQQLPYANELPLPLPAILPGIGEYPLMDVGLPHKK